MLASKLGTHTHRLSRAKPSVTKTFVLYVCLAIGIVTVAGCNGSSSPAQQTNIPSALQSQHISEQVLAGHYRIAGSIVSDPIPKNWIRFPNIQLSSNGKPHDASVETNADEAGQLGWSSLPTIPSPYVFTNGSAVYSYVDPSAVTLASPMPRPSPSPPVTAALYAETTRWPSQCFETGVRYDQLSKVGYTSGALYVYDFCKPNGSQPGTFVASVPLATIKSGYTYMTSFDQGQQLGVVVFVMQETNPNTGIGYDGIWHALIGSVNSNGQVTLIPIYSSNNQPITEPTSEAPRTLSGWSMFETHFFPAPEPCPVLPVFKIKDTSWSAYASGGNGDNIVYGPQYSSTPSQNLNTTPYEYTVAAYNQCTKNSVGSQGYYYAPQYITNSNGDWLWTVSSNKS